MNILAYSAVAALSAVTGGLATKLWCKEKTQALKDKELHEKLSDKQVDKIIEDSFPASDPPSTY